MPKSRVRIPRRKRVFGTKSQMQPIVRTLKKQVNHLMRVDREMMYTDDFHVGNAPTIAGVITYLNPIMSTYVLGGANVANTPAALLVKSINLTYLLTALYNSNVRIILFKDTANKQALPTVAQILLTSETTPESNIQSGYNIDTRTRFKILYDKIHHFQTSADNNAVTQAGPARCTKIIRIKKLFKDLKMEYVAGNGGDITDASKNQLFLLGISSDASFSVGNIQSRIICEPPKVSQ